MTAQFGNDSVTDGCRSFLGLCSRGIPRQKRQVTSEGAYTADEVGVTNLYFLKVLDIFAFLIVLEISFS